VAVAAGQLRALLRSGADVVVLDARRFEEYHTMSIPTATSVPGAEGSWHRRPTGSPRCGEPSRCWPAMVAAGPR